MRSTAPPARTLRVCLTLAAAACSRGESRQAHDPAAVRPRRPAPQDSALPGVRATVPAYAVRPATDAGRVAGTVTLDGPAPADITVAPSADDVPACGRSLTVPAIEGRGGVAGAVVWLVGVAAGKPLPTVRRAELALTDCRLRPRIVAAIAGGALNVHGVDPIDARLTATQVEGGLTADPPGTVLLRVVTTEPGQVVPSERLVAAPGTVAVRDEGRPWLRAWVLAFDQPYFATTDDAGAFSIDGVPPGTYQLVAWHDRLGRVVQSVTVGAGQTAAVRVTAKAAR